MGDRHVTPASKGLEADALKTVTRDDDLEAHSATIDFSNGSEDPASAILPPHAGSQGLRIASLGHLITSRPLLSSRIWDGKQALT